MLFKIGVVKSGPVKIGVVLVKELYQSICPAEVVALKTAVPEQIKSSVTEVMVGL